MPNPENSKAAAGWRNPGMSLAFGSALAYTCYDVGVRALIGDLTVWGLLFLRGAIGVTVVGVLARIFSRPLWGQRKRALALVGLCGFLSSVANATSLSTIPLYQALMIIYLYPVFTLLLAVPINGEPVARSDLGLMVLAIGGGLALIWPDEAVGLAFTINHLVGVIGAVFYSLGQVLIRRMGTGNSGLEPIFHYSLYALIFSLPLALLFGRELGIDSARGLASGLALAGMGMTAQLAGFAALRWIPGFKVGLIGYLELALGAFISWLVFSDPMSPRALAGGVLVVLTAFQLRRTGGGASH